MKLQVKQSKLEYVVKYRNTSRYKQLDAIYPEHRASKVVEKRSNRADNVLACVHILVIGSLFLIS